MKEILDGEGECRRRKSRPKEKWIDDVQESLYDHEEDIRDKSRWGLKLKEIFNSGKPQY